MIASLLALLVVTAAPLPHAHADAQRVVDAWIELGRRAPDPEAVRPLAEVVAWLGQARAAGLREGGGVARSGRLDEDVRQQLPAAMRVALRLSASTSRVRIPADRPAEAWKALVDADQAVHACAELGQDLLPRLAVPEAALAGLGSYLDEAASCAESFQAASDALAELPEPSRSVLHGYRAQLRVLSADVDRLVRLVLLASAADLLGEQAVAEAAR